MNEFSNDVEREAHSTHVWTQRHPHHYPRTHIKTTRMGFVVGWIGALVILGGIAYAAYLAMR